MAVAYFRGQIASLVSARPFSDHREMLKSADLYLVVVAAHDASHRAWRVDALESGVPNVIV